MDLLIISKKSTNPKYISKNESNIAEQMVNSRIDNISIQNSRNKWLLDSDFGKKSEFIVNWRNI